MLAVVPLPFASVHPWAWGLLSAIVGLLLLGWAFGMARGNVQLVRPAVTLPLLLIFGAVLLWALVQAGPFAPPSWRHPLWIDAAVSLDVPVRGSIALDAGRAYDGALRLCAYGGLFWLALHHGRDPARARLILQTIAFSSAVYAAYGLAAYFSGTQTILWYAKTAYPDDLTATFVNKNHYATYAGLGWVCALALFYRGYSRAVAGTAGASERLRVSMLFIERGGWRLLLVMILLAGSQIYAHSRAGFASTLLGILAFGAALAATRSADRKIVRWFAAAALVFALALFGAGGTILNQRLSGTDLSIEERPKVYELTLTAIGDQPFLGTGLSSFEELFRFYRTADIHGVFDYAHETYLETALELGVPAAAALFACLIGIAAVMARGVRTRRRDEIFPCVGLAAGVLVGSHALLDFSVQIPAVATIYAALLGTAVAQSWSSRDA